MKAALALLAAAPLILAQADDTAEPLALDNSAYEEPTRQWRSVEDAIRSSGRCRDKIAHVREENRQPPRRRETADPDAPLLIAAVDRRIDGCNVIVMRDDIGDVRPLPDPPEGPVERIPARYAQLAKPHIRLIGLVDEAMYKVFRDQLRDAPPDGPLTIAITTLGGDPEIARTMADDIRLLRECGEREILFLGKVAVYSAGATFMAGFPIANRYLTEASRIMIHERSIVKTVELSGPLRGALDEITQVLHEIEQSIAIEDEGFRAIVEGSKVDFDDVREKAPRAWYIDCHEAVRLGLIAGVI